MLTTYDAATGIKVEEELSKEMIAERAAEAKAMEAAATKAKTSKDEILAKLNLTADEVAILLG